MLTRPAPVELFIYNYNPLLAWDDNGNPVFPSFTTVSRMVTGFCISDKYSTEINGLGKFFDDLRVAPFDSDPTVEDTDGDGLDDYEDIYPLEKPSYYNDFCIIDDFDYIPKIALMDSERENSEETYNTHKSLGIEFTYAKANLIALAGKISLFAETASDMLFHYLENTGETYNLDVEKMISTSDISKKKYKDLIEKAKAYSEDVLQENGSIVFMSNRINAHEYDSVFDVNWNASVGQCSGILICKSQKVKGEIKIKTRYIVYDFYDWEKDSKNSFIPTVTDGEMYTLHESGYAKQFYVYGEYAHEYK